MNEQQQKLLQAYNSVKPYIEEELEYHMKCAKLVIDNPKKYCINFIKRMQEKHDKVKNALDVIKNTEV